MKILPIKLNKTNYAFNLNKNSHTNLRLNNLLNKDAICFKSNIKQDKQLSVYGMVCFLREAGMNEVDIEHLYKQDDYKRLIKEAYELTSQGIEPSLSTEIVLFKEGYTRTQELIDLNTDINEETKEILKFDKKRYSKAKQIFLLGGDINAAIVNSELEDEDFQKAINLINAGLNPSYAYRYALSSKKIQDKLLNLLQMGVSSQNAIYICRLKEPEYKYAVDLIKNGACANDAKWCASITPVKNTFEALRIKQTKDGKTYSKAAASVIANTRTPSINDEKRDSIAKIVEIMKANCKDCETLSEDLSYLIAYYGSSDILIPLSHYASQIDFEAIKKIAPQIKKYNSSQLLAFIHWHFKNATTTFNKETLTFEQDLTTYFENNFVKPDKLNEILCAHPLTNREIGSIPNDWLDRAKDKTKAKQKIYKAIASFQTSLDKEKLAQNISEALNKPANIRKIGQGAFGAVYKISIEDAKDTCLKIFLPNAIDHAQLNGPSIEPQTGIFVNKNSDRFVKMYFGKVCDESTNDSFIVTQYLDKNTIPEITNKPNPKLQIYSTDTHNKNSINGMIIDFGRVHIVSL